MCFVVAIDKGPVKIRMEVQIMMKIFTAEGFVDVIQVIQSLCQSKRPFTMVRLLGMNDQHYSEIQGISHFFEDMNWVVFTTTQGRVNPFLGRHLSP